MNRATAWFARLGAAAGLGVDAGIHLSIASTQPPGGVISQPALFIVEGVVAIVAALLVLTLHSRPAYLFAALVAGSALAAVVLYRYVDVGTIGPLPNMYEPFWYPVKIGTAVAELLAAVAAIIGALQHRRTPRSSPGRDARRPRS